jgi:hypothetical protein
VRLSGMQPCAATPAICPLGSLLIAVSGVLALALTGGTLIAAAELAAAFFIVSAITAFRPCPGSLGARRAGLTSPSRGPSAP